MSDNTDEKNVVMRSISDALGMAPLVLADNEETSENLPVETTDAVEEIWLSKEDREAEEDFELTRQNTKALIEKGVEALDGILRIASGSEHPRAFEVAANLLKTVQDMNAGLLKLHEARRQLVPDPEPEKSAPGTPQNVTNNNVFVGSTQEFLDMLEEREKKKESNVIEHDND